MSLLFLLIILKIPFYEFFYKSHYLLALFLIYTTWQHLRTKTFYLRIYLITTVSIFTGTTIFRFICIFFRNMTRSKFYSTTNLIMINNIIRAEITIPQICNIHAGDYVYIWIPGISLLSFFQSHPFMIAWWDHNLTSNTTTITLLLKPQKGFTQHLCRQIQSPNLKTWIEGPYKSIRNIEDYGRVVMFASGIGIAAQVPYIKALLEGAKNYSIHTRNILLIWQLDEESMYILLLKFLP